MWLFSFVLSFHIQVQAASCDLSTVYRACNDLRTNAVNGTLKLSDGTEWKVPSADMTQMLAAQTEAQTRQFAEYVDSTIEDQAEVLSALNTVGKDQRLSDRFKMAFASSGIAALMTNLGSTVQMPIRLPLPPDSDSAPLKTVSPEDVQKLVSRFPKATQDRLKALAEKKQERFKGAGYGMITATKTPKNVEQEKIEKVKKIFSETKVNLIESIRRGRPDTALSNEEKSMLRRIETIQLKPPPEEGMEPTCNGGSLDAFYRSTDHTMTLCPAYYEQPSTQIAFVIGHEIGHSIDPCRSSSPLYSNKEDNSFTGGTDASRFLSGAKVYAKEIARNRHPLRSVENCLISKVNIRTVSAEDLKTIAALQALYTKYDQGLSEADYKKYRERYIKSQQDSPLCTQNEFINPEINEAMSDVYGSVALEAYLHDHPLQNRNDAIASIPLIGRTCEEAANVYGAILNMNAPDRYKDEHPKTHMRALLATQTPSLAKALQCTPIPACENDLMSFAAKRPAKPIVAPVSSGAK